MSALMNDMMRVFLQVLGNRNSVSETHHLHDSSAAMIVASDFMEKSWGIEGCFCSCGPGRGYS